MAHLRRHERFELGGGKLHQFGHGGEIPVGVGYHRMPDVCGQGEHRLIDINAVCVPSEHAAHDEAVANIVDARRAVRTAVGPGELRPQLSKRSIDLAGAELVSTAPSTRANE